MLAAIVALLLACAGSAAAQTPAPFTWQDRGAALLDVSCSAAGHCVAVGAGGAILYAGADGQAWTAVKLDKTDPPDALVAVTCRPNGTCIAVSRGGDDTPDADGQSLVFRSTDGGATWSNAYRLPPAPTPLTPSRLAADVACDPSGQCVIVGPAGGIWNSSDGGRSWTARPASSLGASYRSVACPDAGVCVLLASGSSVILRPSTRTVVDLPAGAGRGTAIACESRAVCTASDNTGHVFSIAAGWTAWDAPVLLPKLDAGITSLSCPAVDTCVGLTKSSSVRTTARAAGTWQKRPTHSNDLAAVDCKGTDCIAAGDHASWFESINTGMDWDLVNFVAEFDALDCVAGGTVNCVAVGKKDIGTSASAGDLWAAPVHEVTGLELGNVSCLGFPQCLAFGKSRAMATRDAGQTWQARQSSGTVEGGPEAGACVSPVQCVGAGGGGVYTTLDAGATPWWVGSIATEPAETLSFACPDATHCVAAGRGTIYRGTLTVTDGQPRWRWIASDAEPSDPLNGITCASPSWCVAVGEKGQVFTTTDPQLLHWTGQTIGVPGDSSSLKSVSCPTERVCVATGMGGLVATTFDGWATSSVTQVGDDPKKNLTRVECVSPSLCIAVGQTVMVGRRAAAT